MAIEVRFMDGENGIFLQVFEDHETEAADAFRAEHADSLVDEAGEPAPLAPADAVSTTPDAGQLPEDTAVTPEGTVAPADADNGQDATPEDSGTETVPQSGEEPAHDAVAPSAEDGPVTDANAPAVAPVVSEGATDTSAPDSTGSAATA